MKYILTLLAVFVISGIATADYTVDYGWEGTATIMGQYLEILASISTVHVHDSDQSLYLVDDAVSGTPQAFVALITGLQAGDSIYGEFWRYDVTPGTAPSCRIWGHWISDPNNINSYLSSAGGQGDYGPGTGWDLASYKWGCDTGDENLVIECRTYSNPGDDVWIDDMSITAPDHATILTPDQTSLQRTTWGDIKAAF